MLTLSVLSAWGFAMMALALIVAWLFLLVLAMRDRYRREFMVDDEPDWIDEWLAEWEEL